FTCGNCSERASHERRRNNGSQKNISTGNCGRKKERTRNGLYPSLPHPEARRRMAGKKRDAERLFQQESRTKSSYHPLAEHQREEGTDRRQSAGTNIRRSPRFKMVRIPGQPKRETVHALRLRVGFEKVDQTIS